MQTHLDILEKCSQSLIAGFTSVVESLKDKAVNFIKDDEVKEPATEKCDCSPEEDCVCHDLQGFDLEFGDEDEYGNEEDFNGEGSYEVYAVGSFVIVEVTSEVFVDASINGYETVDGYVRYDVTTKDGLRVVNLHESRVFDKPAYSEEVFELLY